MQTPQRRSWVAELCGIVRVGKEGETREVEGKQSRGKRGVGKECGRERVKGGAIPCNVWRLFWLLAT